MGQVREALGLPPPEEGFHCPEDTARSRIEAGQWTKKTPGQVAQKVGCKEEYAHQCLTDLGKEHIKPPDRRGRHKYRWESITEEEWQVLTDREVARRLGIPNPAVVSQWRHRKKIRKRLVLELVE